MSEPAIIVEGIDLEFTLYNSGLKQISRALLGPVGRMAFGPARTFSALEGVDFTLHRGEVMGLIGNNGSGKSTLLQCMAGIYQPSRGVVRTDTKPFLLAGVGTGYSSGLTGRENIILLGTIIGMGLSC